MAAHICNRSTETEAGRLIASLGYTQQEPVSNLKEREKKKLPGVTISQLPCGRQSKAPVAPPLPSYGWGPG